MSKTISEVIVVEGIHDEAKIKSVFKDADFIITHGSGLEDETKEILLKASKERGLILMLDPDYPGEKLRREIQDLVGQTKHVYLRKSDCINPKKNKVGIEHAPRSIIEKSLQEHVKNISKIKLSVKPYALYNLGLMGVFNAKTNREKIARHFHIGTTNAKTLIKRLSMFSITEDALKEVLNEPSKP